MSDKLFKNDLTPSACQSDGNFGQAAASSAVSLTLPRHALHTPWSPLLENPPPPQRRTFLIDYPVGSWRMYSAAHPWKARWKERVCQPGWDALLGRDQLPSLTVAGEILTPLCGGSLASDSQ